MLSVGSLELSQEVTDPALTSVRNQGPQVHMHRSDRLPGVKGALEPSAEASRISERGWARLAGTEARSAFRPTQAGSSSLG